MINDLKTRNTTLKLVDDTTIYKLGSYDNQVISDMDKAADEALEWTFLHNQETVPPFIIEDTHVERSAVSKS